jgi:hypothetical protein
MKKSIFYLLMAVLLVAVIPVSGQETPESGVPEGASEASGTEFYIGTDLVSRYVWRGTDYGNSPAIQPSVSVSLKGFTLGAWGSYGLFNEMGENEFGLPENLGNYAEVDLYLSYTRGWFTVMLYDYYIPSGLHPNSGSDYFNWENASTGHTLEGSLIIEGTEQLPLRLTLATLFYGADKNEDADGNPGEGDKNNYSTYFEAQYTFSLGRAGVELSPFIGATPFSSSWYGERGGIINLGLTAARDIPFTEQFSLPVKASLVTNPMTKSVFLVFGVTLE